MSHTVHLNDSFNTGKQYQPYVIASRRFITISLLHTTKYSAILEAVALRSGARRAYEYQAGRSVCSDYDYLLSTVHALLRNIIRPTDKTIGLGL